MAKKDSKSEIHLFEGWTFTKTNYLIFGVGLIVIILGYIIMAMGEVYSFQALTISPILLFIGYLVILPIALVYRGKNSRQKKQKQT